MADYHRLAADRTGNLYLAWMGYRAAPGGGRLQCDILMRAYRDGKWSDEINVSQSPEDDWKPSLAADGSGSVFIAWDSYRKGTNAAATYDVLLRKYSGGSLGPLREVSARIAGLLARRGKPAPELISLENSTVDIRSALVMHNSGSEEQLSPGQVALLRLFLTHPRKVLTRDDIIAAAPAESSDAFDRSIDSRIVRLRRKLDTESIVTIRGSGYRFDPPAGWPE